MRNTHVSSSFVLMISTSLVFIEVLSSLLDSLSSADCQELSDYFVVVLQVIIVSSLHWILISTTSLFVQVICRIGLLSVHHVRISQLMQLFGYCSNCVLSIVVVIVSTRLILK